MKPLYGREINSALENIDCFIGTFARDELPIIRKYPSGLIVNTDKKNEPGSHWVAIYFDSNKNGFYFDSFGLPPLHKEIISFLDKNSINYIHNNFIFQNVNSSTCGAYCILFIKFMCKKIPFHIFKKFFNYCTLNNDKLIEQIYK